MRYFNSVLQRAFSLWGPIVSILLTGSSVYIINSPLLFITSKINLLIYLIPNPSTFVIIYDKTPDFRTHFKNTSQSGDIIFV